MLVKTSALLNRPVETKNGSLGKTDDVLVDDHSWVTRYLIVNTGSWLVRKKVLVSPLSVAHKAQCEGAISLNLTREELESSPDIDMELPVSRQHEAEYYRHFKWPYYWTGAGIMGTAAYAHPHAPREDSGPFANMIPDETPEEHQARDSHLRSIRDLKGYSIESADFKDFGHIQDFYIDDRTWAIHYVVLDTGRWLHGKTILLPPEWVQTVQWSERRLQVNLPQNIIQGAPVFDLQKPIEESTEQALHRYYRQNYGKNLDRSA